MSKFNTFLTQLQGCNSMQRLQKIHAQILLNGYQNDPSLSHKLLNFCAVSVSGNLDYARHLFYQIDNPLTSAWNSIIRGCSQSPHPLEAIFLYNRMIRESHSCPDTHTFSFLLKACERTKAEKKCREAHGSIIRHGYLRNVSLCTNLVRCYAGNGSVGKARELFDDMLDRDLVAWNSMISCYSQAGMHDEALRIYDQMKVLDIHPDDFTLVSLLSSCAHLGALGVGVEMHRFAENNGITDNVFVGNALIDMYAKCGCLERASQVFSRMRRRDSVTWNSMIGGLGVHGRGSEAISFFKQMLRGGILPNSITFVGLLCGCSHQGLIKEGIEYFHMMNFAFGLQPDIKHYGCLVDLFGRAGKFEDALKIVASSDSNKDPVLWRTLLSACRIHRNVEMGELAMKNLVQTDGGNAGDFILLSGIYAEVGDKQGVARMRKMIKYQGVKTTPGWSWVEVDGIVSKFVVGDKSHPHSNEIHKKLKEMIQRASLAGYVEEKCYMESVESTEEWSEEWWGNSGYYHSEKLAIAFGLARTPEGTTLRIVKNLRVCRDCHLLTKFVSKAFNREIVVRDRVRFHHFKDGFCSCNDYW